MDIDRLSDAVLSPFLFLGDLPPSPVVLVLLRPDPFQLMGVSSGVSRGRDHRLGFNPVLGITGKF